ncbi:MAG: hypothetical protein AB8B72_11440 [Crocinitomicaceae bacterium]
MKKLLFIAFVGLTLVACNKNQKAVKTLDGDWKATSWTESSGAVSVDYIAAGLGYELQFSNCKLKTDTYCTFISILTGNGETATNSDQYRVTDDGEKLQVIDDDGDLELYTIVTLDKSNLELSYIDDDITGTIKLEKL